MIFAGEFKLPRSSRSSHAWANAQKLDDRNFCGLVIRKLTIEWEQCEATNEASGQLFCTISDHDESKDDSEPIKKTLFITSFVQTSGQRLTEICMGNDKVILLHLSRKNWKIEYFTIKPLFEGQSLNIRNCSLEIELLNSQEDTSGKSDTEERFMKIEGQQISLSESITQIKRALFRQ